MECGFGLEDCTVVSAIDSFVMFEVSLVDVICTAFILIDQGLTVSGVGVYH